LVRVESHVFCDFKNSKRGVTQYLEHRRVNETLKRFQGKVAQQRAILRVRLWGGVEGRKICENKVERERERERERDFGVKKKGG